MTREEAIDKLQDLWNEVYNEDSDGYIYAEALDMAIEALSAETVQGVGRYENAMQKLREMPKYLNGVKEKQIKKISADRPSGEWAIRENGNKECSLCGHERQDGWDYFCGYCGAKMGSGGLYYADNKPSGEWIYDGARIASDEESRLCWKCSECGHEGNPDANYCGFCGAKMGGRKL